MADEFYREEIIIDVNDADATRRIRNVERRINNTFNRMRRQTSSLNRMRARPLIDVRDRMTRRVQQADKLISRLSRRKAAPVITAQDEISKVIKKTDKLLKSMSKNDVKVTARLQGDLLKDIQQAHEAIREIKTAKIGPRARLRGNMIRELKRAENLVRRVGSMNPSPRLTLQDRATQVLKRVQSGLRKVSSRSWEIVITAKDRTFAVFRNIRNRLTSLQGMATIALSFVGLNKLGQATIGSAMDFEGYEVGMTHWLDGNKKQANELIDWMGRFADSTPFSSADLFPALSRGVGVAGGDVKEAKELLQIATDMAAIMPDKTVSDAMEALADARVGEFARMTEFGMKISKEEFDNIGWSGFVDQVKDTFEGAAEAFSETARGQLSMLTGYASSGLRSAGDGILEAMKPRLEEINEWIDNNQDAWSRWKDAISEWGRQGAEAVLSAFETAYEKIDNLFENPEFQEANFFGKFKIAWDELIAQPFSDWYNSTGKKKIEGIATTIGENIGAFIGGGLMALFGVGGNGEGSNDFVNAGSTAAGSFLDGFAKEFDLAKVIESGIESLYNINRNMFESPGNFIGALIADAIAIGLLTRLGRLLGGGLLLIRGLGKLGRYILPGSSRNRKGSKPPNTSTGPASAGPRTRSERNQRRRTPKWLSNIFSGGKGLLKRIPGFGTLLSVGEAATSKNRKDRNNVIGGGIGSIGGGLIGSLLGPWGSVGGSFVGDWIGRKIGGLFDGDEESGTTQTTNTPNVFNSEAEKVANNMRVLSEWTAKASGWVVGAFRPLQNQGSVLNQNVSSLATWTGQASTWIAGAFYPISQSGAVLGHNVSALTQWTGQASGWIVSAFMPLQEKGAVLNQNMSVLSTWLGQASSWVVGALFPLQASGQILSHNMTVLSTWLGQASGWVVAAFQPLQANGSTLNHNVNALTTWTAQASSWVVGAFHPLVNNGATLNHNVSVLTRWVGQASGWVVSAFQPISERGRLLAHNMSALASWTGKASGWIASLSGIQDKATSVKNALDGLASRIRNAKVSNVTVPRMTPFRAYANGGILNRPHLGLVAEDGPEAIIPLGSKRRSRALELYEQTGRMLGVQPYAVGGIAGNVSQSSSQAVVQATVGVDSITAGGIEKEAQNYGETFSRNVEQGINGNVISLEGWKNKNIQQPMQTIVQEAVGFGSGTVQSFSAGQNSTPTNTAAHLNSQVRAPFQNVVGTSPQWGTKTISGFRTGQNAIQTGTRPYLVANVHRPFEETRSKGSGWGSGTISEFVSGMRSQSGQVREAAKHLAKQVEKTFREELGIQSPSRVMMQLGEFTSLGIVKGLDKVDVKKFAEKQAGSIAATFANMASVGGNVTAWLKAAMAITGVPSSWLGPLSIIAQRESGGNPRAINLWDINAKRGTPSMGLMQTIMPTFRSFAGKGMNDIWNPVHNAVAAINYIKSRYGTVFNTPGIRSMARGGPYKGYFRGTPGPIAQSQMAWVGERGPELVYLPRGAQVVPNHQTRQYEAPEYKAPERSYSSGESSSVSLGGGINLNFDLEGLIGQVVVENKEELDEKVEEIAAVIAAKLKAIFENMT